MSASAGTFRPGPARADLHTHSSASDGLLAPADLIRQAAERGLSVVALTDHDTTAGLAEALQAGESCGVRVVPGIELSTDVSRGQLHLLGYGIDPDDAVLSAMLAELRAVRLGRAGLIVEKLRELGVPIDLDSIKPTRSGEAIGRPHIARALVAAGHVGSGAEAFERYIGDDGPAYIESRRLLPEDAVRLVVAAGGLAVLAHPYSSPEHVERLPALIAAGLEGLEVYYGEYSAEQVQALDALAQRHQLLSTGGSDYHGPDGREQRELGSVTLPEAALALFLERLDSAAPGED